MSKKEKRVSIIMVVQNKLEFTRQCLAALFVNTEGFELVLVDDGSTDATPRFIRALAIKHKNISIITNPQPHGFEYSIYQGVQRTRFQTICLLDNDVIPLPGWLNKLKGVLEKGVGAVGAKLLYPDDSFQHGGIDFDENFLPYFRYYHETAPTEKTERVMEVPAVGTACLLTTKKTMDSVIGLSPEFDVSVLRDADFCLKIRELGLKIIYQPQAVLYHFEMEKYLSQVHSNPELLYQKADLFLQKWGRKNYLMKV